MPLHLRRGADTPCPDFSSQMQPIWLACPPPPLLLSNTVLQALLMHIFGCNTTRRRVPLHLCICNAHMHAMTYHCGTWPPVVCGFGICSKRRAAGINQQACLSKRGTFRALRTMRGREENPPPQHPALPTHSALHCPTLIGRTAPRPCPHLVVARGISRSQRPRSVTAPGDGAKLSVPISPLRLVKTSRLVLMPQTLTHTLYNSHTQPQARPLFESASLQPPT